MWKSLDKLHKVDKDISGYGYKKDYADTHSLYDTFGLWKDTSSGIRNVNEPIEIKLNHGQVMWRTLREFNWLGEEYKAFKTQLGLFDNDDRGEFGGFLYFHGDKEPLVDGNFCDMFDFGEYSYAISNLLHMMSGVLKIVRIDKDLSTEVLFSNEFKFHNFTDYVYLGHAIVDEVCYIIVSGDQESEEDNRQIFNDKTVVFKIDSRGNFSVFKEFDFRISYVTSLCMLDNCIYIGRNRVVTKLDLGTGILEHYTHKDDEAINNMISMEEALHFTYGM